MPGGLYGGFNGRFHPDFKGYKYAPESEFTGGLIEGFNVNLQADFVGGIYV